MEPEQGRGVGGGLSVGLARRRGLGSTRRAGAKAHRTAERAAPRCHEPSDALGVEAVAAWGHCRQADSQRVAAKQAALSDRRWGGVSRDREGGCCRAGHPPNLADAIVDAVLTCFRRHCVWGYGASAQRAVAVTRVLEKGAPHDAGRVERVAAGRSRGEVC